MISKRFIIFGGAGFLGQHLTESLINQYPGCKIIILDIAEPRYRHISFDTENVELWLGRDITRSVTYVNDLKGYADALFNLVGYISFWRKERRKIEEINVHGLRELLSSTLPFFRGRIIHVSSVAAIGFRNDPVKLSDERYQPDWEKYKNHYYMYTKHLGELICSEFTSKGLDISIANPGLLYGPGDINTVLPLFNNIASGRLKNYPLGGTGIVDVRDAANGLIAIYKRGKSGERYILNAHNLTFREQFGMIAETLGVEPPAKPVPRTAFPLVYMYAFIGEIFSRKHPSLTVESFRYGDKYRYYSSDRARTELGWEPVIPFEKTVFDMIDWYRKCGFIEGLSK